MASLGFRNGAREIQQGPLNIHERLGGKPARPELRGGREGASERGGGGAGRGRAPRGEAPDVGEGACLVQAPTARRRPATPTPWPRPRPRPHHAVSPQRGRSPQLEPAAVGAPFCMHSHRGAFLGLPGPTGCAFPPAAEDFRLGLLAPDFVVLLHIPALEILRISAAEPSGL